MDKLLLTQKLEQLGFGLSSPPDIDSWASIIQLIQQFETEYRANQQMLEHSFSEVRELHQQLANKTAQYDKVMSAMDQNTNTGDLYDPVHSVMGLLDTIRKESTPFEHQKGLIDMAYSAAESLLDTINGGDTPAKTKKIELEPIVAIPKPQPAVKPEPVLAPAPIPPSTSKLVHKISDPTQVQAAAPPPVQNNEGKSSVDISRFSGLHVLVIDDVESDIKVLQHYLTGWGMEADTAATGGEALKMLFKSRKNRIPYDIIIRDYFMPGKDGLQLFEILSNEPYFKGIPKILLRSQSMFRNEKRHVDFEYSLLKPIQKDALESILSECIMGKFKRKKPERASLSEAI